MRCKVKLVSMASAYNKGIHVKWEPVTSGSAENNAFYSATPSGHFEATLSADAAKQLSIGMLGKEYYVDFVEVDTP